MPFLKSRKEGKNGVVNSREAVTPEGTRVVIAGIRMMCQSVKTVQHLDSKRVGPILGRKAHLGMKIIKYVDNDQLNHPQTSDGDVYAHYASIKPVLSTDQLVKKFHCVLVMELVNFLENIISMAHLNIFI